jgi:hypothetical protein
MITAECCDHLRPNTTDSNGCRLLFRTCGEWVHLPDRRLREIITKGLLPDYIPLNCTVSTLEFYVLGETELKGSIERTFVSAFPVAFHNGSFRESNL